MNPPCPVCGSHDTRREWVEHRQDAIEVVYTCECGVQFAGIYGLDRMRVDHRGEP